MRQAHRGHPARGDAAGQPVRPRLAALAVYLHTRHMVSYSRLVEMLKGLFGLDISEGAIANIFSRAHAPFTAEAERIDAEVRAAAVIASDETSARVEGADLLAVGVWLSHWRSRTASRRAAAKRSSATFLRALCRKSGSATALAHRWPRQGASSLPRPSPARRPLRNRGRDKLFAPGFKSLLKRAFVIGRRREKLADSTLLPTGASLDRRLHRLAGD